MGSSLPAIDFSNLEPALLARSFAHCDAALSASGFSHLGPSSFVRNPAQPGASVLVFGMSRMGPVFVLPVADLVHMESLLPLRSCARIGFSAATLGSAEPGFNLPLHSPARPGPSPSPLSSSSIGPSPFARTHAWLGLTPPVLGTANAGLVSSPSVTDMVHSDFPPSCQTCACLGPPVSILGASRLGSLSFVRSFA